MSSRMGHLVDTPGRAYDVLGFGRATGGDVVFRELVLTCRQGSALARACSSGWFCFTITMQAALFAPGQPVQIRPTVCMASKVTTAPARSSDSRSSVKRAITGG
jgi:hypothetical protein